MKSIPSPTTPLLQQRLQWIFKPVSYLESSHNRYPDIFIGKGLGFGETVVVTSHPQAIQQVLTGDRKQFSAPSRYNTLLQPLLGQTSTIMLDGTRHQKRRQLVMPSFHGERLRAYGELIVRMAESVMDGLPLDRPFLARDAMQGISLQVNYASSLWCLPRGTLPKTEATSERFN